MPQSSSPGVQPIDESEFFRLLDLSQSTEEAEVQTWKNLWRSGGLSGSMAYRLRTALLKEAFLLSLIDTKHKDEKGRLDSIKSAEELITQLSGLVDKWSQEEDTHNPN